MSEISRIALPADGIREYSTIRISSAIWITDRFLIEMRQTDEVSIPTRSVHSNESESERKRKDRT